MKSATAVTTHPNTGLMQQIRELREQNPTIFDREVERLTKEQLGYDSKVLGSVPMLQYEVPAIGEMVEKPLNATFGFGKKSGFSDDMRVLGYAKPVPGLTPAVRPHHVHDADLVEHFLAARKEKYPVLIQGVHGAGKTAGNEQFHAVLNLPFIRIQCSEDTELHHILGKYLVMPVDRGGNTATVWVDGGFTRAVRHGYSVLLNEFPLLRHGLQKFFHGVLERTPLDLADTGETILPHPNFWMFADGNIGYGGDGTGEYRGQNQLDAATRSRFSVYTLHALPKSVEEKALSRLFPEVPADTIENVVKFTNATRKSYEADQISAPMCMREMKCWMDFMLKAQLLGRAKDPLEQGFRRAYFDGLSRSEREKVADLYKTAMAREIDPSIASA